jgi:hypothetical protein
MELLTQNSKLKKTSKHFDKRVFNFGLPAYKSNTGKVVCRMADECIKFCYAQKGAYIWSNVSPAFEKRLQISMQDNFVDLMVAEIKKKKVEYVRVHDSGDYYDKRYLAKWFKIAELLPNVKFYSYTNEVGMIKNSEDIPKNYDFIFSSSGKQSDLIDKKTDRHSKIFDSLDSLKKDKYTNCSNYDLYATRWYNDTKKVGLVYH